MNTLSPDVPKYSSQQGRSASQHSPLEWVVFGILTATMLISGTILLMRLNDTVLENIPRIGGTHVEGIVGTPRFINPLLAVSNADKDITALAYAGLMARNSSGELIPLLASGYTLSDDKKTYTFTLRNNLFFHDGVPLTSADVVYTVEQVANPAVRSPHFANWNGVQIEAPDERTVVFTLPEAYAPFIENSTLGILPKHIWSDLTPDELPFSQFNITPVGAGPYRVETVQRDKSGIPESYTLVANDTFALGAPHIQSLVFRLYRNDEDALHAFELRKVDAVHSIDSKRVSGLLQSTNMKQVEILRAPQLRSFAIYFNHNKQPIFLHDEVREALERTTPKQAVVSEILDGYGSVLTGPIPQAFTVNATSSSDEETADDTSSDELPTEHSELGAVRELLESKGWKLGIDNIYTRETDKESERLAFTLSTVNTPELVASTERVAQAWRELGAEVDIKVYEPNDLTQSIIRPRKYEALLFGNILGHELDLFAFWHSSQRNDPGLNIAQYADIDSDALLETSRKEHDPDLRTQIFSEFTDRVNEKHVAIFLYSPDFLYLVRDRVHNVRLHAIAEPSDRFNGIHEWYVETDRVWPFVKDILD